MILKMIKNGKRQPKKLIHLCTYIKYLSSDERLEYLQNYWYKENINKKHDVDVNKISDVKEESKLPYYIYSTENIFKMSFMLLLFMHGVT